MPNRVIREGLLNSERYWSLSSDSCRVLFVHIILRADDFGLFRAANYTIRATCFGLNAPNRDATSKMMTELHDADLVRLYQVDGADYGIIPRFGQRLRIVKARYPLPPQELRDNDINDLISKMTDTCPTDVRRMSAEVKGSRSRSRSEVLLPNVVQNPHSTARANEDHNNVVEKKNNGKTDRWDASDQGIDRKGHELGLNPKPGESYFDFKQRLWQIINARSRKA